MNEKPKTKDTLDTSLDRLEFAFKFCSHTTTPDITNIRPDLIPLETQLLFRQGVESIECFGIPYNKIYFGFCIPATHGFYGRYYVYERIRA